MLLFVYLPFEGVAATGGGDGDGIVADAARRVLEVVERAGEAPFFVLRETFLCDPDGRFPFAVGVDGVLLAEGTSGIGLR